MREPERKGGSCRDRVRRSLMVIERTSETERKRYREIQADRQTYG